MFETPRRPSVFLTAIFTAWYGAGALAADPPDSASEARPPAGQMCPHGAFVIGFDKENNIVCSETCGNHVLDHGEDCDDGNTASGDGCSATCRSESPATEQSEAASAVKSPPESPAAAESKAKTAAGPPPAPPPGTASVAAQPVVSRMKPSSVVFGAREVTVTIFGSGFSSSTSVLFIGNSYTPSVNQAGTELQVTLPTRELPMGRYVITLSNGPGMEVVWKKGLTIY